MLKPTRELYTKNQHDEITINIYTKTLQQIESKQLQLTLHEKCTLNIDAKQLQLNMH